VAGSAGLGREHPDHAVVGQRRNRVHQGVHQVAVAVTPPQQYDVDNFVGVFVEQLATARILHVAADIVVGVLVPTPLLDNLPSLDAQFAGKAQGVIRRHHRATSLSVTSLSVPSLSVPSHASINASCDGVYRRIARSVAHPSTQRDARQRLTASVLASLS
jgi:hypothetical protein